MITLTPDALHFLIASYTVGLGGSASEINPIKVSPVKSILSTFCLKAIPGGYCCSSSYL